MEHDAAVDYGGNLPGFPRPIKEAGEAHYVSYSTEGSGLSKALIVYYSPTLSPSRATRDELEEAGALRIELIAGAPSPTFADQPDDTDPADGATSEWVTVAGRRFYLFETQPPANVSVRELTTMVRVDDRSAVSIRFSSSRTTGLAKQQLFKVIEIAFGTTNDSTDE
jgi:hypothetical protein